MRGSPIKSSGVRIAVYTKDGPDSSSSFYRLLQYETEIQKSASVKFIRRVLVPERVRKARYDIVGTNTSLAKRLLVQSLYSGLIILRGTIFLIVDLVRPPGGVIIVRSVFPRGFVGPLALLYRQLISRVEIVLWDFDDDIRVSGEISGREFAILEGAASSISVTHHGLATTLTAGEERVAIVPTTDMTLRSMNVATENEQRAKSYGRDFRLVWVGSSSGLPDLEAVCPHLDEAARRIADGGGAAMSVEIVCNAPLQYVPRHFRLINTDWSRNGAMLAMRRAHVGIMPLLDSEFSRGKGAFKAVQYMAAGLPSIVSGVGFNREAVGDGEVGYVVAAGDEAAWVPAIVSLASDFRSWSTYSRAARERWLRVFSPEGVIAYWASRLRRAASESEFAGQTPEIGPTA